MKVVAIVNPISGAGADVHTAEHRTAMLTSALESRGLRAEIHLTERGGHAGEIATAAVTDGAHLVLVWGGDGTANEAGASLLGSSVALGLIPAGSGNGLAAALRTPRDPRAAITSALDGPTRAIDAGRLAGRPFFNIAGIGADARVAQRFNLRAKGTRGRWPYILLGIAEGFRYSGRRYDLDLDGEQLVLAGLLIGFANGGEYGNGVRLTAAARMDDGLLDVVIIEDRPVLARFWHARHLVSGTADRAPRVLVRRVRRAAVRTDGPMEYHVDGEPGRCEGPIEVTIHPRALLVKG